MKRNASMVRQLDGRIIGRYDGLTVRWLDGRTVGRTEGPTVARLDNRTVGRSGGRSDGWADGRTDGSGSAVSFSLTTFSLAWDFEEAVGSPSLNDFQLFPFECSSESFGKGIHCLSLFLLSFLHWKMYLPHGVGSGEGIDSREVRWGGTLQTKRSDKARGGRLSREAVGSRSAQLRANARRLILGW